MKYDFIGNLNITKEPEFYFTEGVTGNSKIWRERIVGEGREWGWGGMGGEGQS